METILYIAAAGLGAAALAEAARGTWRRNDARRREAERDAYRRRREDEREQRGQAIVAELVDRYFPFAKAAWESRTEPRNGRERLRQVLAETDGVVLGSADIGYPAVLVDSARRLHLICLSKSGYGKTSLALRLIFRDLRQIPRLALCILGFEAELFRDWALPFVPADRAADVIYAKFSDSACTLTFNPLAIEEGEDPAIAAGTLFTTLMRAIGETSVGSRADVILNSALAIMVGRPGATLLSLVRLLEDAEYRSAIVTTIEDPYLREFWTRTFPEYPSGAVLPLVTRLNRFLRIPQVRAALCHPFSSFSVRDALAQDRVVFVDLSGFDPETTTLLGHLFLSKFQVELMRRERIPEQDRRPVRLYIDEFHVFAGEAEGTWRELLARGRRYGLGLHLFTQHPNQLPRSLQHEIFGNVSSLIALNLSASDAAVVRRELVVPAAGGGVKPIPAEELISTGVGEGYARLGTGACALKVQFAPPLERPDRAWGEEVQRISWRTYAAAPVPVLPEPVMVPVPAVSDRTVVDANCGAAAGRGGSVHQELQRLAREWGEARGFRATVEEEILGGAGRVDVGLVRDDLRVAVEVAITSTPPQVTTAITKYIAAGYSCVAVLSPNAPLLRRIEDHAVETLGTADRRRICFVDADGFRSFLDGLGPGDDGEGRAAGYRIHVEQERVPASSAESRRKTLARLIGSALLRQRGSS